MSHSKRYLSVTHPLPEFLQLVLDVLPLLGQSIVLVDQSQDLQVFSVPVSYRSQQLLNVR